MIKTNRYLAVAAVLAGLIHPAAAQTMPAPAAAPAVPTLTARTLGGAPISLTGQTGWKVLYFWSSVCPCVRDCEQLSLIPLAKQYAGRVAFFALVSNASDLKAARQTLAANIGTHGLPYAVLLDPGHRVANALHATVTPQTFLLDPENHVVFNGVPDDSWTIKSQTGRPGATQHYLADALSEALAGQPVARRTVKSLGCGIER